MTSFFSRERQQISVDAIRRKKNPKPEEESKIGKENKGREEKRLQQVRH